MAFWNRWFRRNDQIEVKTIGAIGDPIRKFLLYGAMEGASTPSASLELYKASTAVSIPVNRIAELFSTLEPVLVVDGKKIAKHPLLSLLKSPCPEFSQELFFQALATYYLATGECFVMSVGNVNTAPKQLYPISPACVNHNTSAGMIKDFTVTGDYYPCRYNNMAGRYLDDLNFKELIHIRNFNPDNSSALRGMSKLVQASNAARQQLLGVKHNLSILENGGKLSLVFHFENVMDDDDYQSVKRRIEDEFTGNKKGGVLVTSGGQLKVESPMMSNQDMDWSNAQRISNETLLLTYNLPLSLFSLQASTFDNYHTALTAIYDDAVIPLSKIIYGHLSRLFFKRFNIDESTELTFDHDKVTALVMRRNNEVKLRKDIGIETDNELRGMLGREAYAGGDIMYKPSSEIPIGTDILTKDDDITILPDEEVDETE